jgi:hypothetical protein
VTMAPTSSSVMPSFVPQRAASIVAALQARS